MTPKRNSSDEIAQPPHGIETLSNVLRALYAMGEPAKYDQLDKAADIHPSNVSQSLSALKDIGFCESANGRGYYSITDLGMDYVRYEAVGKFDQAGEVLAEAILKSPQWEPIVTFLKINFGHERDPIDLALAVEKRMRKQWSKSMRNRVAAAYVSILSFAGLVEAKNGKMISNIAVDEKEKLEGDKLKFSINEESTSGYDIEYEKLDISQFTVLVRKDATAINFLKSMVKEDTMIHSWLRQLLLEIENSPLEENTSE